ncbi:MAG: hypothetical protein LAT64_13635 [Phycisphaerales bacterium]|nr:hypothetical protein [Planctomycetota bacterium]MCH8509795.1 hypothetical protein [Phycisphaerales bacterium]
MPRVPMGDTPTYFMTWTTYGTWLPGDARGSFVDDRELGRGLSGPKPRLERAARGLLRHDPVVLGDGARAAVDQAIRQHASFRGWALAALNVRTNHVHLVVTAEREPGRVMSEFKARATRATRAVREAGLVADGLTLWTRHGSTRHLHTDESRVRAIRYVLDCQ